MGLRPKPLGSLHIECQRTRSEMAGERRRLLIRENSRAAIPETETP
jgi:hypothetical protein